MYLLTASESERMARRAAANLAVAGLAPGQLVAIAVRDCWSVPTTGATGRAASAEIASGIQARIIGLVLGALRSGIIPVMINPALPAAERDYQLRDCQPTLVVSIAAELTRLVENRAQTTLPELADVPLGRPMHYTSGTTGPSKGVWTGLLSEKQAQQLWTDEAQQWSYDADDLSLVHGPLAHSGPLRFAMLCLLAGGSVLLPGRFNAVATARALVDHRPTTAFVVPSHIQRLFALPGGPPPSPYRLLAHAGAACAESLKRQIHAWAGVGNVWEFYGSTEGQFTACSGPEWERRPGTVGRARAGRTLHIDLNPNTSARIGSECPPDEQPALRHLPGSCGDMAAESTTSGTIWCDTPPFARFEYFGDPTKTAAAWRSTVDGQAFTVGDLGHVDADGYLFLDGRREDLIITGGVNVYPAQIESVLLEHPDVAEVAVFGVDDESWGQRVCAAVVGSATPAALLDWARPRLAPYQRPKQIFMLNELPRTSSGKIKRNSFPRDLRIAASSRQDSG